MYDLVCNDCGMIYAENMDPYDPRVDQLTGELCEHCGGRIVLEEPQNGLELF